MVDPNVKREIVAYIAKKHGTSQLFGEFFGLIEKGNSNQLTFLLEYIKLIENDSEE